MAETAKEPSANKQLEDESNDRIADARQQKSKSRQDIEEAYFFTAPRRVRTQNSQSTATTKPGDAFELQTSLGFEVVDEFMTMIIDSFMPQSAPWAERRPPPFLNDATKAALTTAAKASDAKIFDYIRGSNFYAELAKTGVPDAAIGVVAMDIRLAGTTKPPRCLGVPIRELEMSLGPDGRIDDRFQVRQTIYRKLPALLPGIKLPAAIAKKVKEKPKEACEVRWGYWRLWERTDDEHWQHVVMVDNKLVHTAQTMGEGSCPLIIGRFGATPDFAWPDGPSIKSLPDFRQADEMRAAFIENIDFTLRPPFTYEDDGVLSFEDGIEPGMGYPKRPGGSRDATQKIYEPNPLDAPLFDEMNLEKRIRRLHYCDFPEQKGKTPPTASQWLDEMVEAQKKIGTPGYSFWQEFPFEAFQRFRFLGESVGGVAPLEVEVDGGRKAKVSLQAYNPAQRAQENQDVLTGTRLLQIIASAFPQTIQVAVDDVETIKNFQAKLGDKLVVMRDPEKLKEAFANLGSLAGVFGPRPAGGLTASTDGGGGGGGS